MAPRKVETGWPRLQVTPAAGSRTPPRRSAVFRILEISRIGCDRLRLFNEDLVFPAQS